jgi:hypothetical protein
LAAWLTGNGCAMEDSPCNGLRVLPPIRIQLRPRIRETRRPRTIRGRATPVLPRQPQLRLLQRQDPQPRQLRTEPPPRHRVRLRPCQTTRRRRRPITRNLQPAPRQPRLRPPHRRRTPSRRNRRFRPRLRNNRPRPLRQPQPSQISILREPLLPGRPNRHPAVGLLCRKVRLKLTKTKR